MATAAPETKPRSRAKKADAPASGWRRPREAQAECDRRAYDGRRDKDTLRLTCLPPAP